MLSKLSPYFNRWLKVHNVLQNTCPLCLEPCEQLVCDSCNAMLPRIEQPCFQCGQPLKVHDTTKPLLRCGQCVQAAPAFDLCISPFHYALPINQFVTRLKFHQQLYYAPILAELLIANIEQHTEGLPECIIPVPLHKNRLRQRGFNQALEIARPIARRYAIKLDPHCCRRIVSTPPQMGQSKKARQQNIRHAFQVTAGFNYRHIAIVDDVMTTGQTVNELARVLRQHGARRIQVWCAARA